MAHLIGLGGWLRGLEISAGAIELDFLAQRPKIPARQDLVDYFTGRIEDLAARGDAHTSLFEKIRAGVGNIRIFLNKATMNGLRLMDVKAIHAQARELNIAIRETD